MLLLVGRLISKLANFVAQILIVRYLSQTAYGGFAYALAIVGSAQSIASLGLDRAIVRFLPIYQEQRDYHRLFGTIFMTVTVIISLGIAFALILYGFQDFIGRSVRDEQALALLLVLIFLAPIQALDDLLIGLFAVFAKPRSIFLRRYVLAPGLKLAVVIGLILSRSDVYFLAIGYLASALLGVGIYGFLLFRVLRDQGLFENWSFRQLVVPWREVLGFSIPLLTTDLVYVTMTTMNVVLLQHFWSATAVASYRAVEPTARLSELVMASFTILYTPLAARMFANKDRIGINHLYWQTAVWIAILSYPIFLLTCSLAHPVTLLFYGAEYEQSAAILAVLSIGYYFNAALGFNGLTLKVYGKVRYLVILNVITVAVNLAVSTLLIPRLGAFGAGLSTMIALIVHNILKQAGLRLGTGINIFEWRHLRLYVLIVLCAAGLFLTVETITSHSIYLSLGLVVLVSLFMLRVNRNVLAAGDAFPETLKLPWLRHLISGSRLQR